MHIPGPIPKGRRCSKANFSPHSVFMRCVVWESSVCNVLGFSKNNREQLIIAGYCRSAPTAALGVLWQSTCDPGAFSIPAAPALAVRRKLLWARGCFLVSESMLARKRNSFWVSCGQEGSSFWEILEHQGRFPIQHPRSPCPWATGWLDTVGSAIQRDLLPCIQGRCNSAGMLFLHAALSTLLLGD